MPILALPFFGNLSVSFSPHRKILSYVTGMKSAQFFSRKVLLREGKILGDGREISPGRGDPPRNLFSLALTAHAKYFGACFVFYFLKMAEESSLISSTHSTGSPLPNVDERLAKLRPSKELLEYYRRKISEFDNEHQEMIAKLEKYRCTYEDQVCVFVAWSGLGLLYLVVMWDVL